MTTDKSIKKVLNYRSFVFIYLILFFCISACKNPNSAAVPKGIDQILNRKESAPLTKSFIDTLNTIRSTIDKKDIAHLTKWYRLKQLYFQGTEKGFEKLNLYADSAMGLFKEPETISANKNAYLDALLLKGDALYLSQKYTQAVLFYLEGRAFRKKNLDRCDDRILNVRLGNVYFIQGKFAQSASYYRESYELVQSCPIYDDPKEKFYEIQALLNNTGYSYEKAALLDSALHYFQKDLAYIETQRNNPQIDAKFLNDAAATVLDNLGSVLLKKGKLDEAEEMLQRSINTPYSAGEGVMIPPLIKLAHLYTLQHRYEAAEQAFAKSSALLSKTANAELESRWNKARSEFYAQQGAFELAFARQQEYLVLRDSINKDKAKLASIDIEKDFVNLEQHYNLQNLEKKDATKSIYLIFTGFLLLFVLIIAFLMFRNSKLAKKNSQIIERNNQKLQETLLKLESANQNYARVMKIMAHDLRNPLSGIAGISSFLIEHQQDDEKTSLEIIKASADNALGLINELLSSVLPTQGHEVITFKKEPLNIQLLLQQCISLLNFKADEKQQNITINEHEEVFINGDADKLWRVFNNIIVNAIKFSHEGTTISIDLKNELDQVLVSITDHGIGIPEHFKDRVFEIFTEAKRLGTAGEKPYGLGLSISKQIVEGHQGKIWFEDNPSGGTIFFIQLPK